MATTRYYRCEMSRAVAQYVIRHLIDLKIPMQTEYLKAGIVVVVPGTFAEALVNARDEAQFALDSSTVAGAYR